MFNKVNKMLYVLAIVTQILIDLIKFKFYFSYVIALINFFLIFNFIFIIMMGYS